jgi:nucleoside-diphosphate-sugar epimerase
MTEVFKTGVVDPARAGRILGWRPEVELAAGLEETLRFFGVL